MPNLLERLGQMFGGGRKEETPAEQPMPSESAASSSVGTQPEPVSTVEETTMGTAAAPQTAAPETAVPEPMAGTTPVDTSADVLAADTSADQSASAPAMATEPPVATPAETPAAPAAESAAAPAMESTSAPAMETAAAERTYTVEEGDTLSAIAERFYGSANDWPRIHEANRDQIENPDMIYPGQTLKIP